MAGRPASSAEPATVSTRDGRFTTPRVGGIDLTLLLRGTRTPEVTTATALGATDGTNNVHLTITNFRFGEGIIEKDGTGNWKRVWLPVLTPGGQFTPRPIVAHTKQISNDDELA
jgi:hypothetical protein